MNVKPSTRDFQVNNKLGLRLNRRVLLIDWRNVANNGTAACGCAAMSGKGDSKLSLDQVSLRRIPPTVAVDLIILNIPRQADEVGEE